MNFYETVVILSPSLSDEEAKAVVDKVADIIKTSNGEVFKVDIWGKRRLSYEMNKQKMGNYVFLLYKASADTIKKLEEHFKVLDTILKFMVVKLGKKQIAALPKEISGLPSAPEEAPAGAGKEGV
ncbi:MAG TPA: 30S ribosomal protein S6 [Dissulfurispiraceae bacterium]|nr:30S ribosomal protein S6 [Dissulfurispiraceae bacterium]